MQVPSLSELNPWYKLSTIFGLPNVKWCEAQLNQWITEPANTWSNIAFIIAGIVVTRLASKAANDRLKYYGPAMIILGFFSGIYHASYTFFFQVFDFIGMYLMILIPVFINWEDWKGKRKNFLYEYLGVTTLLTILTIIFYKINIPIQILILALILFIIFSEMLLVKKRTQAGHLYPFYFLSIFFLAIAASFSSFDVTRLFCHPEDHLIQGHALWHVFNAVAGLTNFLFYQYTRPPQSAISPN